MFVFFCFFFFLLYIYIISVNKIYIQLDTVNSILRSKSNCYKRSHRLNRLLIVITLLCRCCICLNIAVKCCCFFYIYIINVYKLYIRTDIINSILDNLNCDRCLYRLSIVIICKIETNFRINQKIDSVLFFDIYISM